MHTNNSRREKSLKTDTQQSSSLPSVAEAGRPPSSQFIPYVRTNEVYYLDPDAPLTRPSTHDPQYRQFNGTEMYCELIHVEEKKCYSDLVQSAAIYSVWYLYLKMHVSVLFRTTIPLALVQKKETCLKLVWCCKVIN